MKITFVPHKPLPDPDADAEQLVNSAAALARAGHQVTLLLPCYPGQSLPDALVLAEYYQVDGDFAVVGQSVRKFRSPFLRSLAHAFRARRHPLVREADVVFTRRLEMLPIALLSGLKTAFDHYRPWGDIYPALRPFLRWCMRRENFLAAFLHSDFTAESYRQLGVPPEKIVTAHNGHSPAIMEPVLSKAEARLRLGLPEEARIITYTGRMSRTKGLDQVMAMAELLPDVIFLLVGGGRGNPVEEKIATIPNMRLIPWQPFDALAPYLYAADILIIPPSSAPLMQHKNAVLPIKTFLYLAAGRPILAPQSPDTEELLIPGETAWLVEPDAPVLAAEAVRKLMTDHDLAAKLAEGALAMAQDLTWDKRAEKISRILSERLKVVS